MFRTNSRSSSESSSPAAAEYRDGEGLLLLLMRSLGFSPVIMQARLRASMSSSRTSSSSSSLSSSESSALS